VKLIEPVSPEPGRPYVNLLPILDFLVDRGNVAVDGGFLLYQDGWRCRLEGPIDFAAVSSSLELPANVVLSEEHDSILDSSTWCSIEGPSAHER
jgi:hypothetical protein